jgi:uncharacterized protein YfiM (DUF2279 family)
MRIILLFCVALLLSASPLNAQIERDKIAHFGLGAVSGAAGAFVASELTDRNRFWTVTGSIAGSLLAGVAKEALDERTANSWDNADLGATVLGGITVGVTIELISKKDGKRYRGGGNNARSNQAISPATAFLQLDAEYTRVRQLNPGSDE